MEICGCVVYVVSGEHKNRIQFCPLHTAAAELRAALKGLCVYFQIPREGPLREAAAAWNAAQVALNKTGPDVIKAAPEAKP